jgi:XRE family transcriptional regulator, aerobic/anaerobic benzoate catabolism transcriptional regulator
MAPTKEKAAAPARRTASPAKRRVKARPSSDEAFLQELGQRVRQMRGIRGMSRKVFSQVSGLSERYLAQLESGTGNVSIVLLRRVAQAAGAPIEDLICDTSQQRAEWPLIRELLRQASPETVEEVKAVLKGERPLPGGAAPPASERANRIALIGLRGAGKSTLGALVAEKLAWRFVELNREIERDSGLSMTEIFSLYGQDGYRRLELAALREVAESSEPMIVATGGGIVAEPVTFELLQASFFTIWLKALPAEHMNRVRKQGDLRPMGNDSAAMAELKTILTSREPLYGRADATIDTTGRKLRESFADLLAMIRDGRRDAGPAYALATVSRHPLNNA